MEKFCDRLKQLRSEKGITQQELAQATKLSQAAVSRWEAGEREPSIYYLNVLADYFEITVDYLIGRDV